MKVFESAAEGLDVIIMHTILDMFIFGQCYECVTVLYILCCADDLEALT